MSHCAAPWVGRPEPRRPSCPSVPPSSPNNRFCQRVTLHCVSIVLLYTYPHNLTLLFAKHWLVGRRRFKKLHDLDNRCDRSHFKSSFSIFKEMFVKWVAAWGDGMGIGETRSCEHKEGDVIIHQCNGNAWAFANRWCAERAGQPDRHQQKNWQTV